MDPLFFHDPLRRVSSKKFAGGRVDRALAELLPARVTIVYSGV